MTYNQYYPITMQDAKTLVISQLRETLKTLPLSKRETTQAVVWYKAYTIPDLIAQIERNTDVGEAYVLSTIKGMREPATGLPYVIG